jgi:hypothetical protein
MARRPFVTFTNSFYLESNSGSSQDVEQPSSSRPLATLYGVFCVLSMQRYTVKSAVFWDVMLQKNLIS